MNNGIQSIIFSAYSADVRQKTNHDRTDYVLAVLERDGIAYQLADGNYKGVSEVAIIVIDTPRTWGIVSGLAALFGQESLLRIDTSQRGILVDCDGTLIASIGRIRAVSKRIAQSRDAYTNVNGVYYVGDSQPTQCEPRKQSGELSCANWDSFHPQAVYRNGNRYGTLQPRATQAALGYGIQGWSRPETETRTD